MVLEHLGSIPLDAYLKSGLKKILRSQAQVSAYKKRSTCGGVLEYTHILPLTLTTSSEFFL